MSAGRPSIPTAIKKLQGTDRADRVLVNEMMPAKLEYAPSAPEWMSDDAKEEWNSACDQLLDLDMLHRVDLGMLAAYCQEMANFIQATVQLKREGHINSIVREDGTVYQQPSPWVSIKNSYLKNAQSIARDFGFTPAARTKISATPKEAESEFEKGMKMDDE